jgi:hypothetical protein
MDEPQYLHVARSAIERDWRFPQDAPWIFFGKRYPNIAAQTHLPVVEYYLAILIKLIGRFDEVKFRLAFAVFPILAVFSFYRLAKRFTASPLLVSSLFAVSPAFFVLSPTLMMDIPMLAFLLAGLSLYLDGIEDRGRLWPSSICFILAAGTGYTALVPLGCLFLWAVFNNRSKREWIAIAAAPAAIFAWLGVMRLHFGQSPAAELADYYTSHISFAHNLPPMFSFVGGVAVFPWIYFSIVRVRGPVAILSILAASILTLFYSWPSLTYRLWFVFLASSGIGLLILFALKAAQPDSRRKPEGFGFLVLWLPVTLLFFVAFAEMISARYILLSLPPLFLVVLDRASWPASSYAFAVTAVLSIALAISDYRFVNSYPDWVRQDAVPLQQQGFRIWNASESGLRFYLEQKGIQTLDLSDLRPRGGELVVRQASFNYGLSIDLEPLLVNILKTDLVDRYPLRTFSRDAGAGFHDSHFGLVPFSFSRAPLDHLEIGEVSPFVVDLPEIVPEDFSSVPVWSPSGVLLKQVNPEMKFPVRIPRSTKVEYELAGKGSVVMSREGIVLKKENPGVALWTNFRIVPETWH